MRSRSGFAVAVWFLLAACAGPGTSAVAPAATGGQGTPPGSAAVEITIFGAASLKAALEEARTAYEASHPGTTVAITTDSSAALATQIEQGAPADVFLSADVANPQKLIDRGFASGDPVVFARNELTIVVPADNPAGIRSPADLAKPGLKIVTAGDEVPITKYAKQFVANLAALPGYPAGFQAAYDANTVSREDNVGAVIAKIELGEGDAAIVYVTDARASTGTRSIPVPAEANVSASYAGVVVRESADLAAADAFLTWFAGPKGQVILARFGFLAPAP